MELLLSVFMSFGLIADSELKVGDKVCVMHDTIAIRDGQVLDKDVEAGSCCDIKAIDGDWIEIVIGEKPLRVRKDFVLPIEKAIEYWNAAIIRQPKEPDFYRSRGLCFYEIEKYDAALNDYQHCVALAPADAFAQYRIASICRMLKRYLQAAEAATVSIWVAPRDYRSLCERSLAYLRLSNFEHAITDVNESIKIKPDYAHGYVTRGFISLQKKQYGDAISDFSKAIEIDPTGEEGYVYRQRGWCYGATREYKKSISDYDKVIDAGTGSASDFYYRGVTKYQSSDRDGALEDLAECIQLDSKNYGAYLLRANILMSQQKYELVIFELDQVEKLNPEKKYLQVAHSGRAVALCQTNRWKQAIESFNKAIEISPMSAINYSMRGLARFNDGNLVDASKDLEKAVALDPKSAYCLGNLACFLSTVNDERFRDPKRAVDLANEASDLSNRGDSRISAILSDAHDAAGETKLAQNYRYISPNNLKGSTTFLGMNSILKDALPTLRR